MQKTSAELQSRPRAAGAHTENLSSTPQISLELFSHGCVSAVLRLQEEVGVRQEAEDNLKAYRQVSPERGRLS